MQTLVLEKPGRLVLREGEEPELDPGEALVRLRAAGICGTDIHAFHGRHPFFNYPGIPGHELAVEILESPENEYGLKPGDICAANPYFECGECDPCRAGKTNCCENLLLFGIHLDGGLRERFTYPLRCLAASKVLAPEVLALTEPLTVGAHAVNRAAVQKGETVLVIGAGPIGLAVLASLPADCARFAVMDIQPDRLAFCRSWKAIEHTIPAAAKDMMLHLLNAFDGRFPDVVFDATGNSASMKRAFDLTAIGGRLIFVGLVPEEISFSDPDFHRRELTVLASRNGTDAEFREVIRRAEAGEIDPAPWITHRCHLPDLPAQLPAWIKPGSSLIKAVVTG